MGLKVRIVSTLPVCLIYLNQLSSDRSSIQHPEVVANILRASATMMSPEAIP